MPTTPHIERHFTSTETVRDIVIGMADGLTVPFALAAGISGAGVGTAIVVTAGLAEIAAGSIAMGLGGYLAARTDAEHFDSERTREMAETADLPDVEKAETASIFREYGLDEAHIHTIVETLSQDRARWVDFMMRFELGLDTPDPKRARVSAFTIAASYIAGGLIPLAPYMMFKEMNSALWGSVVVTMLALFVFGYGKGRFTGLNPLRGGLQTVVVGGLAAGVAFVLARVIG
jgi:VIT1/CCC1 family predicted Fe2+/Mn2+ transporter